MPTITKRGKSYVLNWTDNTGRHRKSLGKITKTQADNIRVAKQIELLTGNNPLSLVPTLEEYAKDYLAWYAKQYPASHSRTYQIIHSHLLPVFGLSPIDQISPRDVEAWKAQRFDCVKSGTVEKELRVFKAMLNQAVKWEMLPRHPFQNVEAPRNTDSKPPRYYTVEEMQAIYKAAPNHRWIWQLMANTGLRRSEALHLKASDIDNEHLNVVSIQGARTKSGKWRVIPLNSAAKVAVKKLGKDYLLPRTNPVSLSRAFANTLERAELDGSLHCLRHTFCSHLVMSGVPLRTVQVLAGHAHFSTTEKYAHLAPDHMKSAVKKIKL